MTYLPTVFGQGSGKVTADISTAVADFGSGTNVPNSPNTNGKTSTQTREATINTLNIGTVVPSNANTT